MFGVKSWCIALFLVATACTQQNIDLDGRACGENSTCIDGYVCNPVSAICAAPVAMDCNDPSAVCPGNIHDGDHCDTVGAYFPCAGTTCDAAGCRTCTVGNAWSACVCANDDKECQCAATNCNACTPTAPKEICHNDVDEDCSGAVDDGIDKTDCIPQYVDADGDGYGKAGSDPVCYCTLQAGYVADNTDPDDTNPSIHPGSAELCNGIDDDGNPSGLNLEQDNDGDGYVECSPWVGTIPGITGGGDCDDTDPAIHPGATERCNGKADACGGIPSNEQDPDGDNYVACAGWTGGGGKQSGDCAPSDGSVHPGAVEYFNGKDDDCDGNTDPCFDDCSSLCGSKLKGCYTLDSASPSNGTPIDSSPTGNDGINSASTVTGRIGNAFDLDATHLAKANAVTAQLVNQFEVLAWVKLDALPDTGAQSYIVDIQHSTRLIIYPGGSVRCAAGDTDVYTSTAVVPTGTWTHVACRRDADSIRIYVNGDKKAQTTVGTATEATDGPLCIGSYGSGTGCNANAGGTDRFIDGAVDHLQIFDEALDESYACWASGRTGCTL